MYSEFRDPASSSRCRPRRRPGPKPPKKPQELPIDTTAPGWQHWTMMSGTEKQFSLTRAAHADMRARKREIPVSYQSNGDGYNKSRPELY
jgi:hypothetical protein